MFILHQQELDIGGLAKPEDYKEVENRVNKMIREEFSKEDK